MMEKWKRYREEEGGRERERVRVENKWIELMSHKLALCNNVARYFGFLCTNLFIASLN